jgi:hypothetical protein
MEKLMVTYYASDKHKEWPRNILGTQVNEPRPAYSEEALTSKIFVDFKS